MPTSLPPTYQPEPAIAPDPRAIRGILIGSTISAVLYGLAIAAVLRGWL